jgi:hypothetical protein
MSFFSALAIGKDRLLEAPARYYLNQTIQPYGHMTHLRIDSTNKRIDVELELKGEASPIQVAVKNYNLTTEAGETYIELGDIETSREWINALLTNYFKPEKRRFNVPGAVKMVL